MTTVKHVVKEKANAIEKIYLLYDCYFCYLNTLFVIFRNPMVFKKNFICTFWSTSNPHALKC